MLPLKFEITFVKALGLFTPNLLLPLKADPEKNQIGGSIFESL